MEIVQKSVGTSAKNWGTVFANKIPGLSGMNDSLLKRFIVRFVTKRAALMAGKVVPAGIGAVIGGFGNRALGKATVNNARKAFGPAPAYFPDEMVIDAQVPTALEQPMKSLPQGDPSELPRDEIGVRQRGTQPPGGPR
jgi:hypothetical protein